MINVIEFVTDEPRVNKQEIIDFFKGNNYIAKWKNKSESIVINNIQHVYIDDYSEELLVVEICGDETSSLEDYPIFEDELKALMKNRKYEDRFWESKLIKNKTLK